jgi:hypothetical protein
MLRLTMLAVAAIAALHPIASVRAQDRHDPQWSTIQWIHMRLAAGEIADLNLNPSCAGAPKPTSESDEGWDDRCRTIAPDELRDLLGLDQASHTATRDVRLSHVNICGVVDLENVDLKQELRLENSHIDGDLRLSGAHLGRRLSLAGTYVEGSVLAERLKADDEVSLGFAHVTKDVSFLWANVSGLLNVQDAHIGGDISLNSAHVTRSVFLRRGDFTGSADLVALIVDGILDVSSATFHRGFVASQMTIGGIINGDDASFGTPRHEGEKDAAADGQFILNQTRITGSLLLRDSHFFDDAFIMSLTASEINLVGATFHGRLLAGESRITTDFNIGCELGNGPSLCKRNEQGNPVASEVFGAVDLRNMDIGGILELSGSTFWESVDLHGMHVGGSLFMNDSAHFARPINLQRARIDDSLMINGSDIVSIDLSSARIGRELRLQSDDVPTRWIYDDNLPPRMLLHNAHVGGIIDTEAAWPDYLEVDLDGFTYAYPPGPDVVQLRNSPRRDSEWWVSWLRHDNKLPAQSYAQLATALASVGDNAAAGTVSFAGREQERLREWEIGNCSGNPPDVVVDANAAMMPMTSTSSEPWQGTRCLASLGYLVQRALVGYGLGYRAFWVLGWVVALWSVGLLILLSAPETRDKGLRWCGFASLDRMLPIVDLNKAFAEYLAAPNVADGPRQYQVVYFWIHALFGWILGLLLVGAISGIAQRV